MTSYFKAKKIAEKEARDAVGKSYGGSGSDPVSDLIKGRVGFIKRYEDEYRDIKTQHSTQVRETINSYVATVRCIKGDPSADEFREKVSRTKAFVKEKVFDKHMEAYHDRLSSLAKQILASPNLGEADKVAAQMKVYHDETIPTLRTEGHHVLEDFRVEVSGMLATYDVGSG